MSLSCSDDWIIRVIDIFEVLVFVINFDFVLLRNLFILWDPALGVYRFNDSFDVSVRNFSLVEHFIEVRGQILFYFLHLGFVKLFQDIASLISFLTARQSLLHSFGSFKDGIHFLLRFDVE